MTARSQRTLTGYLDALERAIVGLQLGNGEYVSAQIDTGFNGLLLFSFVHALELGLGLPEEYDIIPGPGGEGIRAGEITDISYYWLGEYRTGTILVTAPPERGLTVRRVLTEEREPLVLIGTRMLRGCQLSIRFRSGTHFPVKIRKL